MNPPHRLLAALAAVALNAGLASAGACYASLTKAQFPKCTQVTPALAFHWSIGTDEYATFGVDADVPSNSNQYIAVGISDAGGMKGADFMILMKYPNGTYYMVDAAATDYATPVPDTQQDVLLLTSPTPSDVNSVYTFKRPLSTCDTNDNPVIQGLTHALIWSHGPIVNGMYTYHTPANRGTFREVLWVNPAIPAPVVPANSITTNITMPGAPVPSGTKYLCTHFQGPSDKKYHVSSFAGFLNSTGNSLVHHMILYGCSVKPSTFNDKYDCGAMEPTCSSFLMAWVPGAPPYQFPAAAGLPIGLGGFQWFSLQIHFNNPTGINNIIDSSGIAITYSSVLRANDVGVLWLGQETLTIPGNNPDYTNAAPNVCPGDCTSRFPWNLTVFAALPHMHSLGYNFTTQHIRNGVELPPLNSRRYYDYSFQVMQDITEPLSQTIMPGDTLISKCVYTPTLGLRTNTTTFGLNTDDEMCFNFIFYYPAMPSIDHCISFPLTSSVSLTQCSTDELLQLAENKYYVQEGLANQTSKPTDAQWQKFYTDLVVSGVLSTSSPVGAYKPYVPSCSPSAARLINGNVSVVVSPSLSSVATASATATTSTKASGAMHIDASISVLVFALGVLAVFL